jgi:hypothetical protein
MEMTGMKNKVSILGSTWTIHYEDSKKNKKFKKEDLSGYADFSVRKIYIRVFGKDEFDVESIRTMTKATVRHEVVHAFLCESGLFACSLPTSTWALNEEMVDWIAYQYPKIHNVFRQLNVEDV